MKLRDIIRWMTTALAATAILALTAVFALAVYGVPGAGDTSLPAAASPQTIARMASVSHAQGIVLASEDETNSGDAGQPPEMDDQGTDNPPDPEDDYYGEDYYAGVNSGIVDGPGWYGPGRWYGPDGWFLASGWWYAPPGGSAAASSGLAVSDLSSATGISTTMTALASVDASTDMTGSGIMADSAAVGVSACTGGSAAECEGAGKEPGNSPQPPQCFIWC